MSFSIFFICFHFHLASWQHTLVQYSIQFDSILSCCSAFYFKFVFFSFSLTHCVSSAFCVVYTKPFSSLHFFFLMLFVFRFRVWWLSVHIISTSCLIIVDSILQLNERTNKSMSKLLFFGSLSETIILWKHFSFCCC